MGISELTKDHNVGVLFHNILAEPIRNTTTSDSGIVIAESFDVTSPDGNKATVKTKHSLLRFFKVLSVGNEVPFLAEGMLIETVPLSPEQVIPLGEKNIAILNDSFVIRYWYKDNLNVIVAE